jgi:pilus assembly protein CpaB
MSLILAALAGIMAHAYAAGMARNGAVAGPTVSVVVAAEPIRRGETIRDQQLHGVPWPESLAPPGSFRDTGRAVGRVALADLAPGEAVTETRLARVRAGPVASLIPEGSRAFAVPSSLPSGTVVAGDHVDVLATYSQEQGVVPGAGRSETVIAGAEVALILGAGGSSGDLSSLDVGLDTSRSGGVTLVLLVTPEEQERLAYASSFANLQVSIEPA